MMYRFDSTNTNATGLTIEMATSQFRRLYRAADAFTVSIKNFVSKASSVIRSEAIKNRSASIAVVREMAREETRVIVSPRRNPPGPKRLIQPPGRFPFYQGSF